MDIENKKILVLAPHTDDGELGCGGTIAKLSEKNEVFYVAFSSCQRSLPEGSDPDVLKHEVKKATKILGIESDHLFLFDFQVRDFPEHRQAILEEMIVLREKINPELVFVPSPSDIHQDHKTISEEGLRAYKNSSILGYEMPWNNVTFNTRSFIVLDESNIKLKVDALKEYKSQLKRGYLNEDFVRSLAKVRGLQIGVKFAEAFEVIRWVLH
ncbi:PIG-L family deacetylase [Vicingaceae bacterium]|nr:PIG-L family deacetylase [Vicingaceae bacterium]